MFAVGDILDVRRMGDYREFRWSSAAFWVYARTDERISLLSTVLSTIRADEWSSLLSETKSTNGAFLADEACDHLHGW